MTADGEYVQQLGAVITEIRSKQKRTKSELAKAAGVDRTYLGKIEQGMVSNVSIAVIRNIAKALDISILQLIAAVENKIDESQTKKSSSNDEGIDSNLIKSLYPTYCKDYPITSLFSFLMFLPLMDDAQLADVLLRIQGDFSESHVNYVLEKLGECVDTIPTGLAKDYASFMVRINYDNFQDNLSEHKEQYLKVLYANKLLIDSRNNNMICLKNRNSLIDENNS